MAKYYDIYTQIPGIKPFPQEWVVKSSARDPLVNFNSGLMKAENIVATTAKNQSNTKTLVCRQEYFICLVESQFEGDD
ncbi:hypothetical protein [Limosilactobacillus allomucosae]|uniref:hypothetical protein n=1 Tax=Limosilactobacillus allomucosae TaxID=3142938 RepID=UPI0032642D87